ncbi:phage tail tape measure protein [Rhizobium hainanense]|uniref:Prophage tail length tape measure protein n=1 Tax=Rhizobium hainanense TaxID=52131 RepID=A0A1C3U1C1_9HYPH|nr:phage tail tape measure protein [Rhizobium hainanense]SCB09249.1 hypothetical protein GA0061100_101458 [Rhizobium hainanense]
MQDITKLGIQISTAGVDAATASLDDFSSAATRTQKAAGATSRAFDVVSARASLASGAIGKANAQALNLVDSYGAVAGNAGKAKSFLVAINADTGASTPSVQSVDDKTQNGGATSNNQGPSTLTQSWAVNAIAQPGFKFSEPPQIDWKDVGLGVAAFLLIQGGGRINGLGGEAAAAAGNGANYIRPSAIRERAGESLDAQDADARYLADRFGDEIPAAKEYADQIKQAKDISDLVTKVTGVLTTNWAAIADTVHNVSSDNESMAWKLNRASVYPESKLHDFGVAYEDFQDRANTRRLTVDDIQKIVELSKKAYAENGDDELGRLAASLDEASRPLINSVSLIKRYQEQAQDAYKRRLSGLPETAQAAGKVVTTPQIAIENKAARTQSDLQNWSTAAAVVPVGDSKATSLVDAGSNKVIRDQKDAVDGLTKSSQTYTEQTKLGTQTSTQSAAATENVKSKVVTLKQSQDELQKSCAVQLAQMPQLTKAANDQADAYRRVAEAQALQKLAGDIRFQQEQMGRSTIDQTVASTQKQYGLPVDMNSASANIIRYNEQLKYARELAGDFASTLVSGLRNGEGLWKSLGKAAISVLTKISDRLLNDVLNSLFKVNSAAAGGGLFGGGGIFGGLFGGGGGLDLGILARSPQAAAAVASGIPGLWADGGYTGPGGKHEPAGIVHAGEVVWSQKDIARAGGVGVVEAMRLGRRGYADGGVVGEGGPQLLRAQPDVAVPVRRLRADNQNDASGSASGVHVTVGVSVDEDGNLKAYVKNVAQSEAQSSTRQGLNDFNQQLPDRVAQINRNPRRR